MNEGIYLKDINLWNELYVTSNPSVQHSIMLTALLHVLPNPSVSLESYLKLPRWPLPWTLACTYSNLSDSPNWMCTLNAGILICFLLRQLMQYSYTLKLMCPWTIRALLHACREICSCPNWQSRREMPRTAFLQIPAPCGFWRTWDALHNVHTFLF